MKKILILALPLFFGVNVFVNAQGTSTKDLFTQNPSIQASIVAAADDSIEERRNHETGEIYFVRQIETPWDGTMNLVLVEFDKHSFTFINIEYYTYNGDDENNANTKPHKPCSAQQDSCRHYKQLNLLKSQKKVRPQPHRSSRVKLAEDSF